MPNKPLPYKATDHTSRCSHQEAGSWCDGVTCPGMHYRVMSNGQVRHDSRVTKLTHTSQLTKDTEGDK